jgi:hypothetical protein
MTAPMHSPKVESKTPWAWSSVDMKSDISRLEKQSSLSIAKNHRKFLIVPIYTSERS